MPCCLESPRASPSVGVVPSELRGYPVWLHVYELGRLAGAKRQRHTSTLQCGVEVVGLEHAFETQGTGRGSRVRVIRRPPSCRTRSHPHNVYWKTVSLGLSPLRYAEILAVLQASHDWPSRGCIDYAARLIEELLVPEPLPVFLAPATDANAKALPKQDAAGPGDPLACTPTPRQRRGQARSPALRHAGTPRVWWTSCSHVTPGAGIHEFA